MPSGRFSTDDSFVLARLPRAGLGNKLFVWAEALVFARLNGLPLVVAGWCQPQVRHWWRSGDLRFYWNYLKPWQELSRWRQWQLRRTGTVVRQPPIEALPALPQGTLFEFATIPHWKTCFEALVPHRELIRSELLKHLTHARQREIAAVPKPVICAQVRLGDFRPLRANEQFSHVGGVRTPMDYFVSMVEEIRRLRGADVPVTVVSDGRPQELEPLLRLPNTWHHRGRTSIADLMLMAHSQLLICSAGSTYSQWGGFLGTPILLQHPEHFHYCCRPPQDREQVFEGAVWPNEAQQWPELLKQGISRLDRA